MPQEVVMPVSEEFQACLENTGFSFEKPVVGSLYHIEVPDYLRCTLTGTVLSTEEYGGTRMRLYVSSPRLAGNDIIYVERVFGYNPGNRTYEPKGEWTLASWIQTPQGREKVYNEINLRLF